MFPTQKNDSLQGEPHISGTEQNSTNRPKAPKNVSSDQSGIWIQWADN